MTSFIADGQLAATAASLVPVGGARPLTVNVSLYNASTAQQTVYLTITRAGSTARVLATSVLQPGESMYAQGIGLVPTDTLSGYSTSAASVDYLVNTGVDDESFVVYGRDASGAPKGATLVSEIRDMLWKIAPA